MMNSDYQRVKTAIEYIEKNSTSQPSLDEVAEYIGLSPYHFQRLFTSWAGISPKRFLQFITLTNAKKLLKETSVLDTAYEVGLSSPSRLHDLFISSEGISPGEYKTSGDTLNIRYGSTSSPFGECFVAETERGICHLSFDPFDEALVKLRERWQGATLTLDNQRIGITGEKIFQSKAMLPLHLKGTNFQIKVWSALLRIPEGQIVTYSNVAKLIGNPKAVRAVGTAAGQNNIGYIIPCHRVLRKTGDLGGYRWGLDRKKIMIAMEAGNNENLHT